jgi:hypothetical protein
MRIFVGNKKRIPVAKCLQCDTKFESVSGIGGDMTPAVGAFTICAECGFVTVFDQNMHLRPVSELEARRLSKDPRMQSIQMAIIEAKKK